MTSIYRDIGAYEILATLGSGGMADVYVARDRHSGAKVALKVPRPDPDFRRAELDGARLQRHLAAVEPRIPRIYAIDEDGGVPYIAMEFVEGEDLASRIGRGPLASGEAIRIAIELCEILAVVHACASEVEGAPQHGVAHGDLKPSNVRLEPGGRVRPVDFGIAKALSEKSRRARDEFRSLAYASPERLDSVRVDAHCDLWALAVVLYEMLAGRQPFRAATQGQLEQRILSGEPPDPLPASCPPALDAVLRKAFARAIGLRYANADSFRQDLEAVASGQPALAESEERARAAGERATNGAAHGEATRRPAGSAAASGEATHRSVLEADATRRTLGGAPAEDATRRTIDPASGAPGAGNAATPAAATASPPVPVPARGWSRRIKRFLAIAAVALVINEGCVMRDAGGLESDLAGYQRTDANQVWRRYRGIQSRSRLGVGAFMLGRRVRDWHVAAADDLIGDYLSDTPVIRERGWKQALALVNRSARIDRSSSEVQARVRYCQGQLARIDAEALLERRAAGSASRFNEARRGFEDAARLRRWPDPHLGLARVFAIGFADVERTRESLDRARGARYRLGERETALLADAHRLQAERTFKAVAGLPEEERYLDRIETDCDEALRLYDDVPAYREVSRNIRRVHDLLARVDARRQSLRLEEPLSEPDTVPFQPTSAGGA